MSTTPWSFASNPFANVSKGSFKMMHIICDDHDSKLMAAAPLAPELNAIYVEFHPYRVKYDKLYSDWMGSGGTYEGSTQLVYDMLSQLSGPVIDDWDVAIMFVHKSRTPEYKRLMPNGRAPFQKGGVDQRIAEVETLLSQIGSSPALAVVKGQITTFYTKLKTARDTQQGNEGARIGKSDALEAQRILTAQAMYRALGRLITYHWQSESEVEGYYDLENIRSLGRGAAPTSDPTVSKELNEGATIDTGLTIAPETPMRIRNTGAAALRACLSATAGVPCDDSTGNVINPGEEVSVTPADLGKPEGGFLTVTNLNAGLKGSVEVYLD
jgi:hypothetical protein